MSRKTSPSKRKAKRQIKIKDNKIEVVSAPETKKPVRRRAKFYAFICVLLLLNGIVYSYWLADIFGNNSETPKTQAKNLPNPNKKAKSELPPDWDLPPQNAPIDRGYNASSGQFPPGAMPQGVTLPYGSSYNPMIAQNSAERSPMQSYGVNDGVRQQFTGYPRDAEIGLDYAQNRYYNSQHGRFTSVDPENAGADPEDPQSWNGYAYARNNPLLYTDRDGLDYKICNTKGECFTQSDEIVLGAQQKLRGLFQETDRNGHYDSGNILNEDGSILGTYQRVSIDPEYQLVYSTAEQSIRKAKVVGGLAAGAAVAGACIGTGTCAAIVAAVTPIIARNLPRIAKTVIHQGKKLNVRPDVVVSGGRTGSKLQNVITEANSIIKGARGRVYVTDQNGKVILDISKDRVKEVIQGQGFGPKRPPTAEEIQLIKSVWK